jgi:hypothetical protein
MTDQDSQTVIPRSKVKEELAELHKGPSEDTWGLTRLLTRSDSGKTDYTRKATLRGGANDVTPAQQAEA